MAQWYLAAFAATTGNPTPDLDTLYIYHQEGLVLIVGFKDACFVGAARLPLAIHNSIYTKLLGNRTSN